MSSLSQALANLASLDLKTGATALFATLGYTSDKTEELPSPSAAGFAQAFNHTFSKTALESEWKRVELLFQLTGDEVKGQVEDGFNAQRFESFLFFALDLKGEAYARGDLAKMARELSKPFPMPVVVLFRYGQSVSLASLHRRQNKRDQNRDVLERVVLLKDIRLLNPHRAHLEILSELGSAKNRARDWKGFLDEWNRVLDINTLNKKFFAELSDWYFHARHVCTFPQPKGDTKSVEEHVSTSLIRLITRVMFAYFLKERDLVPARVFEPEAVQGLLKDTSPESSSYYKAVLQNLFFATLNTEIGERDWKKSDTSGGYNPQFMVHNKRRYRSYFQKPENAEALFNSIPFLNGGLFECLDKTQTDRYDGFSERKDNPLNVPNALFWGAEQKADLKDEYGETRVTLKTIKPLLQLFAAYKFTIAENTPLEEEVALDPELLGKVFENLLASYNPETRATARKQSGSFYTPREIVDYMVEESLVAYLCAQTSLDETTVRPLFHPASDASPSIADPKPLIAALEKCTLLDPAVGSGAFPMGALHKMVELLRVLDPQNKLWRAQLEASARGLEVGSEGALAQIAQVFEGDGGDYARKLYLIQNCLFGVDIQPIAIQIAKLRFFISLAVEQKSNGDASQNFGIRPLPNLETKLVAANTLLGLGGQQPIPSEESQRLQAELKKVRADHFKAQSWSKKKQLRAEDERLRGELASELQSIGMAGGAAEMLAHWNPYDQNQSAPFFDPHWMFGVESGFGVVMGNPPYVFARDSASKGLTQADKDYYYANYALAEYQVNLYPIFVEAGQKLLATSGVLCLITPNNWLTLNTNKKLRQFVLAQSGVSLLNFYARVFESADVDAAIMLFRRATAESKNEAVRLLEWTKQPELIAEAPKSQFLAQADAVINIEALKSSETGAVMAKIEANTRPLSAIASVKSGLMAYETGKGTPPQTEAMKNARIYHSETAKAGFTKYLDGRDVCRYRLGWSGEYLKYGSNLAAPRNNWALFSTPRILVRQIPSPPPYCINACFTDETILNDRNSMNIINVTVSPLMVLGILNSRLMSYWFVHKFGKMQRGIFPQFKVNELAIFPMPLLFAPHEKPIIGCVEKILAAKKADAKADTSQLEAEIDALVYALYGLEGDEIALVEGK